MKKKITGMMLAVILVFSMGTFNAYADEATSADDIIKTENETGENPENKCEPVVTEEPSPLPFIVTENNLNNNEEHPSDVIDQPSVQPDIVSEIVNNDFKYEMPETEYISVQDIVVSDFKKTMFIDETQNLSATVFPLAATDHDIYYSSSNQSVAKVDKLGKVTAVGSGSCTISISCGGKYVGYSLDVKVKTDSINVKSKYIVLKPGEEYDLEAKAVPDKASQSIKYKSQNTEVVAVSENGILKATGNGSTLVLITNDDYTMSVNVIVNTEGAADPQSEIKETDGEPQNTLSDPLAEKIRNSAEEKIVMNNNGKITSEALKALYGTEKTLIVECDGYDIYLNGCDVVKR